MATTSKAIKSRLDDQICQGDIFQNVKYSYIDSEDDEGVNVVEYEFPMAIIVSQACDVIAMEEIMVKKSGKPTKFMPSILMCPIYENTSAKTGQHIKDAFDNMSLKFESENTYQTDDYKVAKRDWHYRIHALTVESENKVILENAIIDFKHYFTVPISYLISHKKDRVLHLDDLFAEQITLKFATYINAYMQESGDTILTDAARQLIDAHKPDFVFLYLGETDEVGHKYGWLSEEYEKAIYNAFDCIERVWRALPADYTMIIQADHGGHTRGHGTEMPEDMTIPVMICGKRFAAGKDLGEISIKDIAPTVAALLDTPCAEEWEGKSLVPADECYGATCS